jgi:hypothetical protein
MALTAGPAAPPSPLYVLQAGLPRLRVSVVLACSRLPAWLDESLAALLDAPFLEVQVLRDVEAPARRQGSLAWRTYHALDRRLLGELRPIMARRALSPRLAEAPLPSTPEALRAAVAGFTPDVVLSVGHSPGRIDLWPLARRAAWSIPAEACKRSWGLLHLLPAFLRGDADAPSGLPVNDDRAGRGLLLDPAIVSIAQLSFARNTAYQLQKAPAKLLRALRRLQQDQPPAEAPVDLTRAPGTWATLALCGRLLGRSLLRHLPRLRRRERWTLAARRGTAPLDPTQARADGFTLWTPPRGWFWADPFPYAHQGIDHVFFEAYDYARAIGEIHAVTVDREGRPSPHRVVMQGAHHLSYPFLFEHGGEPHLLVECAQSRRIEAFRTDRFPEDWKPVATLLEGWRAVDATVVRHDGRWWLFACVAETPFEDGGREFNELFLFHAEAPLGPWTPHRQNPVVTDVRSARPAGPLFVHEGRLVRPSQDCAAEYGHRIVFNEVLRLDPDVYDEAPLSALHPDWAPALRGCHTYARAGRLELLDAKRLAPVRDTRHDAAP